MNAATRRLWIWSIIATCLLAALAWSFWPRPLQVESALITRGPLSVEVSDEGRTRVREIYQLSAPVAGRLLRIEKHSGDPVVAGKPIVADLLPIPPSFLDLRSHTQGEAALSSAVAARDLAQSLLNRAKAELAFATSDVIRSRNLAKSDAISQLNLEKAELAYDNAKAQLTTAEAYLRSKNFDLQSARAQLMDPSNAGNPQGASLPLKAQVSGRVLRVLRESEAVVAAGTPIMEIGDPGDLEIVVDLISEDAAKVHEGDAATISDWGGIGTLAARVRRVEPSGFTKVSALGIEEQRVNVILDFVDPRQIRTLADGYRVTAHIVIWQSPAVLRVPASAMFRSGTGWAVFKVDSGRATLTPIETGPSNDSLAEVRRGLADGDRVILHPSDRVRDGLAVSIK